MVVGAALGVVLAVGVPSAEVTKPPQDGAGGQACGTGPAIIGLWMLLGRLVVGATVGGFGGGLAALLILLLLSRLNDCAGTAGPGAQAAERQAPF
jgi:hypothetical protein